MGCRPDCGVASVANVLAPTETKDSLVIAIGWLAYGPGAIDDNVD